MSPEQQKLLELFSEALAKSSLEEREHFLAAACGPDAQLRSQLESLLKAQAKAGDFLQGSLLPGSGPGVAEGPGTVIGRYKLLQQIGEGGFGVVFMAEQQQPVRRLVALKILKPGMETKEVLARFEAGRQALALMDHPNIARVLDGGATESGRPYFVMELVKGVPLTDFCAQHQLPVEQRLRLFLKVCAGVQHAHQKGVIHRDLKPANVLVTLHDGEPVPKVIDFGIAKALGQKLTERTLFTRFEQLLGTPAYMSPEQAEWSGLDIDTRSDLYSLGVLLYELLTGTTPLQQERLARAALDEVRRLIREVEPPRPSTRLTDLALKGATLPAPHRDRRRVCGDLDWIVMKALEKDRTRRYDTVHALARDLEHHLKGEPVVACPPSKTYLAGKFFRKHRVAVTTGAAIALALMLGLVLALLGFAEARRGRAEARVEAAATKAVSDFLAEDFLGHSSPEKPLDLDWRLRMALDRMAAKTAGPITNQPLAEASIRLTLGRAYDGWGNREAAETHLRRALALRAKALGPEHPATLAAQLIWANFNSKHGAFFAATQQLAQIRQVSEQFQRSLGPEHPETLKAWYSLGKASIARLRIDEAEDVLHDVFATQRRVCGPQDPDTLATMRALADLYAGSGRYLEATAMDEGVLQAARQARPLEAFAAAQAMKDVALDYLLCADPRPAAALLEECQKTCRRLFGPNHRQTLGVTRELADAYGRLGSWAACVNCCREVARSTDSPELASACQWLGAPAALLAGDTNAYREFTAGQLAHFGSPNGAAQAQQLAQLVVLAPNADPELTGFPRVLGLVPSLVADWKRLDRPGVESLLLHGAADYRRGNLTGALKRLESWRESARYRLTASQAGYFCAMIHYRQGDAVAAKADLQDAGERLAPFLRSGALPHFWNQIAWALVIRAEAERLVLGRPVSPGCDAAWLESARRQWEPVQRHLHQAERLAQQGKWPEAHDEYLAAIQDPAFDWETAATVIEALAAKVGITFLLAHDEQNHEQLYRKLFARTDGQPFLFRLVQPVSGFSVRDNTQGLLRNNSIYPVCEAFLARDFRPASELGPAALQALKEYQALKPDAPLAARPTFINLTLATASYRSADYAGALEQSKRANIATRIATRSATQLLRAMALGKLGRWEEGKKELAQAEAQISRHLTRPTGDFWWDLGLCQVALDEAHQLFRNAPSR